MPDKTSIKPTAAGIEKFPGSAIGIWVAKNLIAVTVIAALLFWSAGRLDWLWGWVFTFLLILNLAVMCSVLIPHRPDLLAERSGLKAGTKKWDMILAPLMAHGSWITGIVAGLDVRNGWSPGFGLGIHLSGLLTVAAGMALIVWAMFANRWFAATVRIQSERGHIVAAGGPYRFLRHPGYAGVLLVYFGLPAMLGSFWAYGLSLLGLALTVARTALEDATLRRELPGYAEYANRTRRRLVPALW